jgi:hypothetical protein
MEVETTIPDCGLPRPVDRANQTRACHKLFKLSARPAVSPRYGFGATCEILMLRRVFTKRVSRMENDGLGAALRRAQPLNRPLPATLEWVASLPTEVRPLVLLHRFPRIANRLAQSWSDNAALSEYFNELLIDRRGGRQGFPPDVRHELSSLREFIAYRFFAGAGRRRAFDGH